MTKYTIHAGDNSTDLGQVSTAETLAGAKLKGRAAVARMLPDGDGTYTVRDGHGQDVLRGERSIRTAGQWVERS